MVVVPFPVTAKFVVVAFVVVEFVKINPEIMDTPSTFKLPTT